MTKIEWADRSWNTITGCTKVSQGCRACYAAAMHPRLRAMGQAKYQHDFGEVRCHPEVLDQPLHWRKPSRVFVNSMSDTFHPDVPAEFVLRMFEIMERASRHTFLVLTKRPERMIDVLGGSSGAGLSAPPLPNVWLGVSVENQAAADERIPLLLKTPAAVRFLSCEPLLGPIDLARAAAPRNESEWLNEVECGHRKIHQAIVGSESGPRARPMSEDWVRSLRDQCQAAGVAFFYKQKIVDGRKISMPELDGVVWDQMPGLHESTKGGAK